MRWSRAVPKQQQSGPGGDARERAGAGLAAGRRTRGVALFAAGALAACLALACGEPSPEAQLAEARESLERARQERTSAQARYDEATRELEKAQQKREEAARALEQARSQVEEARARMGRFATDDAIFRSVQSALLDDEELGDTAIPVRVQNGVVTLTGTVTDPELAQRAEELAAEVAGVIEVRNAIEVRRPQGERRDPGGEGSEEGQEGSAPDAPEE